MSIVDLRFSTNSTKSSNDICFVQNIWEPYVVYIRICFDLLNFFCRGNCPSYWTFFIPSMVLQSINLMKWFSKSSIYIFNLTVFHEEFVDNSKKGVSTVLDSRMFCSLENKFILKKKWPIVKTVGDIIFNIIFLNSTSYLKWFIKSNIVRIKLGWKWKKVQ